MISVIGGTYREIDYDQISTEIYGSGFRCVKFLLENACPVSFNTSGNDHARKFLTENQKVYDDFSFDCNQFNELITFKYSFALAQPSIFPDLPNIEKSEMIKVNSDNVIAYGMLESEFRIKAKKVVYDPQTSTKPESFSSIGEAEEVVYIVNKKEAQSLSKSKDHDGFKKYFFEVENAIAFIVKDGPNGATLFYEDNTVKIPSYITDSVNKIGSGDIFTSSFGYYWFHKNLSFVDCAINASKSVALFCDKNVFLDCSVMNSFPYKEFNSIDISKKRVYLASPFFSISELILIDKIRTAFLDLGICVFSPFHDVGLGSDQVISEKDLRGIDESDIVFCVLDNLDSGTLIESGYSLAENKKIIGYQRTSDRKNLLMLMAGDFKCYQHLTTAIYHTIWSL
jgi:hypothetical protein